MQDRVSQPKPYNSAMVYLHPIPFRSLFRLLMKTTAVLPLAGSALFAADAPSLTLEASRPIGKVSPLHHGLMTEEINHCYDGGLYAELIQNRVFKDDPKTPVHWSAVQGNDASATIALEATQPADDALGTSLRLDVSKASETARAGVANDGYWGIPVKPETSYRAFFHAKAAPGFTGPAILTIESEDGATVYAQARVTDLTAGWKSYSATLTTGKVTPTAKARFTVTLDRPGTVWLNFVSLFPPTWNNRPNGNRADLMQMMVDMKPKFLRFPGGNYLQGNTPEERFPWKKTLGSILKRPGHQGPWGYRSSDGMGLLEFLLWCEELKAEPILGVYAGFSLPTPQNDQRGTPTDAGADLQPFIDEALEEIEYVTGPVTSKWGAQRAKDGHPQPFKLNYVEIGNEDWFDKSDGYDKRYARFHDAIKARYPKIQLISSIGNEQPAKKRVHSRKPDLLDEHYYRTAAFFAEQSRGFFDKYDRKGPRIFVGEWAAHETAFPPWDERSKTTPPTPDLRAALGDACFMAAMERRADLVTLQCYAPLFVNINPGARQWRPNLIGYDALSAYGSPSYHAIRMFSNNIGDSILDFKAAGPASPLHHSVTKDEKTGVIYLKTVNFEAAPQTVGITVKGVASLSPTATAITLSSASPDDTNSIHEPAKVVPVTTEVSGIKPAFSHTFPPHSITVLLLNAR